MPNRSIAHSDSPRTISMFDQSRHVRKVIIDDVEYFSVLDVFELHGSDGAKENPSKYWQRAVKRMAAQGADIPNLVSLYQFEGERQRPTPIATLEAFFRISQSTEFHDWEPLRLYQADSAVKRMAAQGALNIPSRDKALLKQKQQNGMTQIEAVKSYLITLESRGNRNQFTDALKGAVIEVLTGRHYSKLTDMQYQDLFGMPTKAIREETGYAVARDGLTDEGRIIVSLVDSILTKKFKMESNLTFNEACAITHAVCIQQRVSVEQVENLLGVSLVTGKPLLGEGRK